MSSALKEHAKSRLRRPDIVLQLAAKAGSSLSWDGHEQLFLAALDSNNISLAETEFQTISNKFGLESARVMRLLGMLLEASGKFDDALEVYTKMLATDSINLQARKRRVAVFRAQGKPAAAITELKSILTTFMTDFDSWAELGDLYIQEGQMENARYCYEELILHAPYNHLLHQTYAEILYSLGEFLLARRYYCQALELNKNNLRAIIGLNLTTVAIAARTKSEEKTSNDSLFKVSIKEMMNVYRANNNPKMAKLALAALGDSGSQ